MIKSLIKLYFACVFVILGFLIAKPVERYINLWFKKINTGENDAK